jgi:CubicO group peptidase (beta-lactamase class C family)
VPRVGLLVVAILAASAGVPASSRSGHSGDQSEGFDPARLARIDAVVAAAIADRQLRGAVVLVGRGDRVVWQKAYGDRAVSPAIEPMTLDTIFDLASLTKVVATTTAVMMLVEDGTLRLSDRVAQFIPEFGTYGKQRLTLRDLLTHTSGLRPDVDLGDDWAGYDEAIRLASEETPTAPPGQRFVYSDINFFLLAEVVARAAGTPFDRFVRDRIFTPLGMADTGFTPPAALRPRIAPTEACTTPCEGANGEMLRGVVHDPTARRMGGVAGHAGLFSTAADLARFCEMLLGGGALGSARILSPLTVARMTSPASPTGVAGVRGLGWDIDSAFSSNRGELLPLGSFGHTGFTGTSLWIDPDRDLFVILLTNRVHAPRARRPSKVIADIRADVADAAALSVRNSQGVLMAMPASFRADRAAGWNRPIRSRSSRSMRAKASTSKSKKPVAKPSVKKSTASVKVAAKAASN